MSVPNEHIHLDTSECGGHAATLRRTSLRTPGGSLSPNRRAPPPTGPRKGPSSTRVVVGRRQGAVLHKYRPPQGSLPPDAVPGAPPEPQHLRRDGRLRRPPLRGAPSHRGPVVGKVSNLQGWQGASPQAFLTWLPSDLDSFRLGRSTSLVCLYGRLRVWVQERHLNVWLRFPSGVCRGTGCLCTGGTVRTIVHLPPARGWGREGGFGVAPPSRISVQGSWARE